MWLLDRDRRFALVLASVVVAVHLALAGRYGWFRDELYYVACGERLAWGYVDHPPVVALVARVARLIFGDSLVGLRTFAALAGGGAIVLSGEIARAWGGGRVAQTIAPLATAIAPYDLFVGQIYTMNAFEPLVWGAIALVVGRALRGDDPKPLVWLGPIVGIGILNKHSAAWPVAALAIALALSPSRRLLVRKQALLAAAIATLIVAPHLVWQLQNGFPTREFAHAALSGKNEPYGVLGLVGQQVQMLNPALAPLWMVGLVALLVSPALRRQRPMGVAYLLVAALVFATQAKAYYLVPAASWLFAAGAIVVERVTAARPRARIAAALYGGLAVAAGVALAPTVIPILTVPSYQRYARALGALGEAKTGEKNRPAALPQLYADMHGWPEMARVVESVVAGLSPEDCADTLILAENYGEASAIEHFGRGLPPVASGNTGWWLWGLPRPAPAVLVAVGNLDADVLEELFEDVKVMARIDHPLARASERDLPVYVCRRPRLPLAAAWPRMKHYR